MPQALLSPSPLTASLGSGSAFGLLCACSVARPAAKRAERIAEWQFADFDWEEFFRIAEHHGVLALAARNLLDYATGLPSEVQSTLESVYAANFRRSLWFAAELTRVTRHFEQKRIRAIPYKGPALAQSAYGDLALRSFNDLDLLIAPADFFHAKNALAEIGYQPSKPLDPAVERFWLRHGYECSFDGPAGRHLLELQWALLPHFYAVDPRGIDFDDLWARSGRIDLGNDENSLGPFHHEGAACLSPEDSLLVLALHAAKHLWTRLIWVADIAQTLAMPNLNLALLIKRARALGLARILGVNLWLAGNLLHAAAAPAAQELIDADPEIPAIGQDSIARLAACASYSLESAAYFRQVARLRERRRDRQRYLWLLASTPGEGELAVARLPEPMFLLYRGVRMARLLRRLVSSKR
ncbi:MAG TPA: nucleotidyltransferase family protein [Candidatus Saccharimonadales bacterium]|nr:nucleotidyltransferase family protein [Candidatus Saccharimonadales bacterium]